MWRMLMPLEDVYSGSNGHFAGEYINEYPTAIATDQAVHLP